MFILQLWHFPQDYRVVIRPRAIDMLARRNGMQASQLGQHWLSTGGIGRKLVDPSFEVKISVSIASLFKVLLKGKFVIFRGSLQLFLPPISQWRLAGTFDLTHSGPCMGDGPQVVFPTDVSFL